MKNLIPGALLCYILGLLGFYHVEGNIYLLFTLLALSIAEYRLLLLKSSIGRFILSNGNRIQIIIRRNKADHLLQLFKRLQICIGHLPQFSLFHCSLYFIKKYV